MHPEEENKAILQADDFSVLTVLSLAFSSELVMHWFQSARLPLCVLCVSALGGEGTVQTQQLVPLCPCDIPAVQKTLSPTPISYLKTSNKKPG